MREGLEQPNKVLVTVEVRFITDVSQNIYPHYSKDATTLPANNEYSNTSKTSDFVEKKVLFSADDRNYFRELIEEGMIEDLIVKLKKRVDMEGNDEHKDIVSALVRHWRELEQRKGKGVIQFSDHLTLQNEWVDRILDFIRQNSQTLE